MGVTVNIRDGGLGRTSANPDNFGGLFIQTSALLSGWTEGQTREVTRLADLEAYGIKADATDEDSRLVFYHVSEVFRLGTSRNNTIKLYLQLGTVNDAEAILTRFNEADDKVRNFAIVLSQVEVSTAVFTTWETAFNTLLDNYLLLGRAVISCKKATDESLPDFSGESNIHLVCDIANDITERAVGGEARIGIPYDLLNGTLGMCGAAGTYLGQWLLQSVHMRQSWREYPVDSEGFWEKLGDINGDVVNKLLPSEVDQYNAAGTVLVMRDPKSARAYISSARTASTKGGSDYDVVNNGRVVDKAIYLLYVAYQTFLDAPVYGVDGKLFGESISRLEQQGINALSEGMVQNKSGDLLEISVDDASGGLPQGTVTIDPDQDVAATDTLNVQIVLQAVGAASNIVLNIGYGVATT